MSFRPNTRNADDIFAELFGFSSLSGGMGSGGGGMRGSSRSSPFGGMFGDDDVFSSFGEGRPMNSSAPRKAAPIEHKLACSLEELYKGTTKKMKVSREIANASGAVTLVSWSPPLDSWFKINTDGASKGNPGPAAGGGVFRDSCGNWCGGFLVNIGFCSAAEAELRAARTGLHLARKHGFMKVQLEMDCLDAVQWLSSSRLAPVEFAFLIDLCRSDIKEFEEVKVVHIYREGNQVADFLANEALRFPIGVSELSCPPSGVMQLLKDDLTGVRRPRSVALKTLIVEEILTIEIKPGWKKGTKITFSEKGNEQPNVIPADLIFIIDEKPHSTFTREGNDLVVTKRISLAEALTGYTGNLTTLDGRSLTVPINNVIHPDYEEIVPKEGMPISKDLPNKGNLRIKFNIKFPTRLTAEQKLGIKELFYFEVRN